MATKKSNGPASAANGAPAVEPVVEPAQESPRTAKMTKIELQRRVHALEVQVAWLKAELEEIRGPQLPWWEKICGSHADDPVAFEEAMRLGREWRESFRPKKRSSRKKTGKAKSSDGRS